MIPAWPIRTDEPWIPLSAVIILKCAVRTALPTPRAPTLARCAVAALCRPPLLPLPVVALAARARARASHSHVERANLKPLHSNSGFRQQQLLLIAQLSDLAHSNHPLPAQLVEALNSPLPRPEPEPRYDPPFATTTVPRNFSSTPLPV